VKVCPICGKRFDDAAVFCQKDGARLTAEGPPDPFVGREILGQFRIDEAIGAGGMGTVYRAHQTTLGRDVAVKILHPELNQNSDAVRRFHREARVATQLEHPNLVRVYLFGELPKVDAAHPGRPGDGNLYLVMEYLDGESLTEVLEKSGPLPVGRALHLATQICDAVGVAHGKGIVHRDIKPENVMIVRRGDDPDFVKVLDFGIARLLWDEQSALTQSGVIFGTARYISPEGAAGEPTDARSDVYGIGVLVYQLLSGVTPFEAATPVAMLMKHIHDSAPPLHTRGAGASVPAAIADVVMRALSKNPEGRYEDASALGRALRTAAQRSNVAQGAARSSWVPQQPSLPPIAAPTHLPQPTPTPTAPVGYGAPSTGYGGPSGPIQVAGLGRRPAWVTMLFAFLFGAAAVVGGVYLAQQARSDDSESEVAQLEQRARDALAAGNYDAPPGENVADLTQRLTERDPRNQTAQTLRREAALLLRERAATARGEGRLSDAMAAYQRVLTFQPNDPQATRALEELRARAAQPPPPPPGLTATPEQAQPGDAVAFVAHVEDGADAGEAPRFEVFLGRRRVTRVPAAVGTPNQYLGSYVFRRAGTYEVRFVGVETLFTVPVGVRSRRPVVAREDPVTTQSRPGPTGPQPTPPTVEADSDGIDWTIPSPGMTPMVTPMTTPTRMEVQPALPPAPWTGGASTTGAVL